MSKNITTALGGLRCRETNTEQLQHFQHQQHHHTQRVSTLWPFVHVTMEFWLADLHTLETKSHVAIFESQEV